MNIDPATISQAANLLAQLANWHVRTFARPEPWGSQDGEDALLDQLFDGAVDGVYVDVGAGDPVSCSNTFRLWERGWRGLLIEPRKDAVYSLCCRRWGDMVYPAVAETYSGVAQLRLQGSVSSIKADWNIEEQTKTICPAEPLRDILAKFPSIRDRCQLCSIDVEGAERQALEGIDWATFRPRVFIVEYLIYGVSPPHNDATDQWEPILLGQGYRLYGKTSLNKVYVRD